MSLDLQEPISTVRSAAHTAVEKAVDLAPSVDLPRTARRAAKRAERTSHTAARRAKRQVEGQVKDLRTATRHRRSGRGTVLTVVALAAGLGVAVWLVRRRAATAAVPEVAPDPFGTGVAATEGPAVHREPAANG